MQFTLEYQYSLRNSYISFTGKYSYFRFLSYFSYISVIVLDLTCARNSNKYIYWLQMQSICILYLSVYFDRRLVHTLAKESISSVLK